MSEEQSKLEDGSGDRNYYVMIPQIVWALCEDIYDLSLWCVVKMIAGEKSECYLGTRDLATLAMMSISKVSKCRRRLIAKGLLEGEIRCDPGYTQAVWHLRVPDLWRRNLEWREALGDALKTRIELKEAQKGNQKQASGEGVTQENTIQGNGVTQETEGVTHVTEGVTHVTTKKNQEGKPREGEPANSRPPAILILHQITGQEPPAVLWEEIATKVGESEASLTFWREVIRGWLGCGWKAGNVNGMIDWFERGEIPSTGGAQAEMSTGERERRRAGITSWRDDERWRGLKDGEPLVIRARA